MLTVCSSLLLFTACTLEKKLYSKGYHIEWKTRLKANEKAPETSTFEAPDQTRISKTKSLVNASTDSTIELKLNDGVEPKLVNDQADYSPSNAQESKPNATSTSRIQTDKKSLVKKDVNKGPQKDQKKPNYPLFVVLFCLFAIVLVTIILVSSTASLDFSAMLGFAFLLFLALIIGLVILFIAGAINATNQAEERKRKEREDAKKAEEEEQVDEEGENEAQEEKEEDRPLTEEEQFLKDLEESKTPAYKKRRRTQIVMGFFIAFIVTFLLLVSQ